MIEIIVAVIIGAVVGGAGMYLYTGRQMAALSAAGMAADARIEGFEAQLQSGEEMKTQMEQSFKALSSEVLNNTLELLTRQAGEKLSAVGDQITQNIGQTKSAIGENMDRVSSSLTELLARATIIDEGLKSGAEISQRLADTTQGLQQVLSSSQARGSWGERMVEDILRTLGMEEGLNYEYQKTISTGERPDFTFNLPDGKDYPDFQVRLFKNSRDIEWRGTVHEVPYLKTENVPLDEVDQAKRIKRLGVGSAENCPILHQLRYYLAQLLSRW